MKQKVSFRMDEADFYRVRSDAREAGMSVSDYLRALVARRPTQNNAADAHMEARLARIETLALAAAVSAYEAQVIAIAALPPEKSAKVKEHRNAQFAVWRQWGVQAAYIGPDMRPKITKEHADE
ncbi:MAG: plasmid mobilization protein [Acidiferrobacter thiooxydans]